MDSQPLTGGCCFSCVSHVVLSPTAKLGRPGAETAPYFPLFDHIEYYMFLIYLNLI